MSEGSTDRISRRTALLGATAAGVGVGALAFPTVAAAATAAQYNVQSSPYEARGDGSTDDWRAIQEAINAARGAGGGTVYFPAGTYIVSRTLTLYSHIYLVGAGVDASFVKLRASANTDLVVTDEYARYLGTGQWEVGVDFVGLADITLDGNSANNTSGTGFKHYGRGLMIRNATIRLCAEDGISSERGFGGDEMEAHVSGLSVRDCGRYGIDWRGPHDSTFVNVHVIRPGSQGIRVRGGSGSVRAGYGGAGTMFLNAHVWGGGTKAWNLEQQGFLTQCSGEGASETQLHVRSELCSVIGGHFYSNETSAYAITHGDSGVNPRRTIMHTRCGQSTRSALKLLGDGGYSMFNLVIEVRSGVAKEGEPNVDSQWVMLVDNGAGASYPEAWTRVQEFGGLEAYELVGRLEGAGHVLRTVESGRLGFHSATPIAKPTVTGSRGGNAALASLLTALANYGLITNSTT